MSCFILDPAHIDVLVNAAAQYGLVRTGEEAAELGTLLVRQNYVSVNYRYDESDPAPEYRPTTTEARFDPVALTKVISCYAYQSGDAPGWERTKAAALCRDLLAAVEATMAPADLKIVVVHGERMPAYKATRVWDDAPWGVDSLSEMPLARATA